MSDQGRRLLLTRKQDINVYLLEDGKNLQVDAQMKDNIHEMRLQVTLSYPQLKIRDAKFEMPGVPDPLCADAVRLAESLIGQHAVPGLRWGGEEKSGNCLLLKDLFRAATTVLSYAQSIVSREELDTLFPGITEEQRFKIWTFVRPDMKNTCLRYADDSPFMLQVQEAAWPEGADQAIERFLNPA